MAGRMSTEDRQRQIAEAALKIISEQGLGRFTTSAIASEVGLSEGAIFRHFASKEEIVLAAMDVAEAILDGDFPEPTLPPLERLREFVRRRSRTIVAHPFVPRILFSEDLAHAAGAAGAERLGRWRMRTMQVLGGALAEAAERGEIRTDVPLQDLMLIGQGTILGSMFVSLRFESIALLPELTERAWATFETLIRS